MAQPDLIGSNRAHRRTAARRSDAEDIEFAAGNEYDRISAITTQEDLSDEVHEIPDLVKYKLSSDRRSTHTLTLYIQGKQDEGSYQCVDSKSETPVKKTIHVLLSKIPKNTNTS